VRLVRNIINSPRRIVAKFPTSNIRIVCLEGFVHAELLEPSSLTSGQIYGFRNTKLGKGRFAPEQMKYNASTKHCFIKHHVMKAYGEMDETQFARILNLCTRRAYWVSSRPKQFNPGRQPPKLRVQEIG
jgi:hypothetical protein